jgi:rRNA processing protein Gar1
MVAVFGPTSNVVDPLAPLTAALITAVIGTLTDVVGNVATAYVSGVKSSRRTEQT